MFDRHGLAVLPDRVREIRRADWLIDAVRDYCRISHGNVSLDRIYKMKT